MSNIDVYVKQIEDCINLEEPTHDLIITLIKFRYLFAVYGINDIIGYDEFTLLHKSDIVLDLERQLTGEFDYIYHKISHKDKYLVTIDYNPKKLNQMLYIQVKDLYKSSVISCNIPQVSDNKYDIIDIYKDYKYILNKTDKEFMNVINNIIEYILNLYIDHIVY